MSPFTSKTSSIDPGAVADNGVGDDAWCEEEFEEQEADEEDEGEEEDSEDEENAEEDEEDEPVRMARAAYPERAEGLSPAPRRQPGAQQKPIVAEIDENAIARHLLAALDSARPPESSEARGPAFVGNAQGWRVQLRLPMSPHDTAS